jgi:hypothetical protein
MDNFQTLELYSFMDGESKKILSFLQPVHVERAKQQLILRWRKKNGGVRKI